MKSRVVAYLWAILVAVSLAAQRQVTLPSEVEPDDTIADEQLPAPEQSVFGSFGDSLGVRFLGSWPFGYANVVAADGARELVICASGGGVYVLDVSDPTLPRKISERIHASGYVQDMRYDQSSRRLYLLTSHALEIWDVADVAASYRLGSAALAGAWTAEVVGAYAYAASDSVLTILSIADPRNPREVGRCWLSWSPTDIAIVGQYAFVADVDSGVRVIDVQDPAHPLPVACCSLPEEASERRLAVQGSHVYAIDDYQLSVIDVSNPLLPSITAVNEGGSGADALMWGGYLLVSCDDPGLEVFDISDPSHPFVVVSAEVPSGRLTTAGNYVYVASGSIVAVVEVTSPAAGLHQVVFLDPTIEYRDIEIQGNLAFAACGSAGLRIVDVDDPERPVLVGSCGTHYARAVALHDHFAYVADDDSGLSVVDVADPGSPNVVGRVLLPAAARDVDTFGYYALVATYGAGLRVVDVSDPRHPLDAGGSLDSARLVSVRTSIGHAFTAVEYGDTAVYALDLSMPANPRLVGWDTVQPGHLQFSLSVVGNRVYLCSDNAIRIVDASDPSQLRFVAFCPIAGSVWDVAFDGDRAYAACSRPDLAVLGAGNPDTFVVLAYWSGRLNPRSVAIRGGYALLGGEGLGIIDVTNPVSTVSQVGENTMPSRAYDVAVANDFAFVADYSAGLKVVDVLNPDNASEIGWLDTRRAYQVKLAGDFAYLADYGGVQIVDVSDPTNPRQAGYWAPIRAYVYALAVSGHYAFVGCRSPGVKVVDISDPANPVEVGGFDTRSAYDVAMQGSYLYVADYSEGLKILNVSNPEGITEAGTYRDTTGKGYGISVAVGGRYAYLGNRSNRVEMVDISDTANLRLVASVSLPDDANRLTLVGSRLYVGCDHYGLRVIDVSDTANVRQIGYYDTDGRAWGVAVDGRRVYVADYSDGLQILGMLTGDVEESGTAGQLRFGARVLSNPARGAIRLSLTLPGARDLNLQLLDVTGRAVNSWRVTGAKAGANAVTLPCKGIASGVYFLRARAGSEDHKLKVVLTD